MSFLGVVPVNHLGMPGLGSTHPGSLAINSEYNSLIIMRRPLATDVVTFLLRKIVVGPGQVLWPFILACQGCVFETPNYVAVMFGIAVPRIRVIPKVCSFTFLVISAFLAATVVFEQ